jgi:hypothetical protein
LGADASADGWEAVGRLDEVGGLDRFARGDELDEPRDVHVHRARRNARGLLADQATRGLELGLFLAVAEGDLVEIGGPDLGVLLGHGGAIGTRGRGHFAPPFSI